MRTVQKTSRSSRGEFLDNGSFYTSIKKILRKISKNCQPQCSGICDSRH